VPGGGSYLAFFRRRDDDYDRIEKPSVGMVVSFVVLGGACVAFGALPQHGLDHVVRPAASSLTAGDAYARAVIGDGGRLPVPEATFHYLDPVQLLVIGGTLVLGLLLATLVVRRPQMHLLRPIQALHTGSVNDYATYAVVGAVVCVLGLALG